MISLPGWISRRFQRRLPERRAGPVPSKPRRVAPVTPDSLKATPVMASSQAQPPPTLASDVDPVFYPWLIGVDGFDVRPLSDVEEHILETFEHVVTGQRAAANLVPRLPMVIPQLMQSLKDERTTGVRLARLIKKDPVLAGEVIRLANSAFYRRARKITSIGQAVFILGRDGLRELVARVTLYPIFNVRSGRATRRVGGRIWCQSERCAVACSCLAERRGADVFAAYLTGLVSNVGLMAGFRLMDQVLGKDEPVPSASELYRQLINQAERLTRRVLEDWDFPEAILEAVNEKSCPEADGPRSSLGEILHLGDHYGKLSLLIEDRRIIEGVELRGLAADPCLRRLMAQEASH